MRWHRTDFLDSDDQRERAAADAAIFRGEGNRQDVVLREELLDVPGELSGLIDFGRSGLDPLQAQIVDQLADFLLLLAEEQVHRAGARSRAITNRCTWLVPS